MFGRNDELSLLYQVPWIGWCPMGEEEILKDALQEIMGFQERGEASQLLGLFMAQFESVSQSLEDHISWLCKESSTTPANLSSAGVESCLDTGQKCSHNCFILQGGGKTPFSQDLDNRSSKWEQERGGRMSVVDKILFLYPQKIIAGIFKMGGLSCLGRQRLRITVILV